MSDVNNISFTGQLFADGRPLVLNYQVMEQRLKQPRITMGQRLSAEISLNDELLSPIVTFADHDDAEPLLLEFVPVCQGRYTLKVKTPGRCLNWRLQLDQKNRYLLATKGEGSDFELETFAGKLKSFGDLPSNPASVALLSVEKKMRLFQSTTKEGLTYFLDKSPNNTGQNAFNSSPVWFVLKTSPSALTSAA